MSRSTYVDYLIVGAGPAGLQLAYFLDRAGKNYLVVEGRDRPGTFFEEFPRRGMLISINKPFTGYEDRESQLRYDWNSLLSDDEELAFTRYTKEYYPDAKLYAKYLQDYAAKLGLRIRYKTRITDVTRCHDGYNFEVADDRGDRFACRALVVANGMWDCWTPNIPGIEHCESYADFSVDPADYEDQRVLILGKGNSGFETADTLVGATRVTHVCSPSPIKMAWKTHFFGHLRAVNNNFLDTYILKGQNSVLDADIERIEKRGEEYIVDLSFTHAEGQRAQFAYDRVLVCTGFKWNHSMFPKHCKPELTQCGKLPSMTSAWESTNLPHLYYAGTLMQMRDRHKTMSNVLHGFRWNIKSLACILGCRYDNDTWPSEELPRCPKAIAKKIIERVSTNSGLMHQPGFLSDLLVMHEDRAEYFETLAVDYIKDSCFSGSGSYYTITMEYGDTLDDILAVNREPDPNKAYNDFYLHPRVQHFSRGEKIGEHHLSESLENEWRLDKHPGKSPLIRRMEFHGQEDATQFQQTHYTKLVDFLDTQMKPACHAEMC